MEFLCGNAVVGQSGGPTAAINATLSGVIKGCAEAHKSGVIKTLYGMKNGVEGFLREDFIDIKEYFGGDGLKFAKECLDEAWEKRKEAVE